MGRVRQFRSFCGIDEVTASSSLWKAMVAEYIGTAVIVLIGCGSCINWGSPEKPQGEATMVQIAIGFGITVASMVQALGHVSGGHLNPAVTIGMLFVGRVSLLRSFFYLCSQLIGGITGAAILRAVTPEARQGALGGTGLSEGVTPLMGLGVETCITFILVLTVFGVCDANRLDVQGSAPLAIGLSVTTCHVFAVRYTGAGMNVARSFGPAVMSGMFDDHWVFWLGPILGGVIAAVVYENVFQAPPITTDDLDKAQITAMAKLANKEVIADRTTSI
uniref:Putative aquaporin aqpcic-like protein n=1 Tax=Amblyomma aureolatum TaxID=187763 RepID=A0A1E1XF86_9ACAR